MTNQRVDMTKNDEMMETEQNRQSVQRPGGWLWVCAGVLVGLIMLQGGGFFESQAMAEMATTSGTYSMMTTDGGNDEILVVVDSRQESLMVYRTLNTRELVMLDREELSSLFSRARARAVGSP